MTIDDFVAKWHPILTMWNGRAEDPQFIKDCRTLGFEMDGGKSIQHFLGEQDWLKAEVLREHIKSISNMKTLGSALFSYWRYLVHGCAPLPEDAIEWFKIIFQQLKDVQRRK